MIKIYQKFMLKRWRLLKSCGLLLLLFYSGPSAAVRDIFNLDTSCWSHLTHFELPKEDLRFIGCVNENNVPIAFLEDVIGNIYQVRIGYSISGSKVVKIFPDEVLLSDGQHFSVIK